MKGRIIINGCEDRGNMKAKVTLKQIAEKAGTSIGTVDRALNNRGRINAETKAKILLVAEELNYRPNILASSLSKKKKINIGILMSSKPMEFCDYLRHGIEDALEELDAYGINYEFIITDTLSPKDQMTAIKGIDIELFDAFLINAGSYEVGNWINDVVESGKTVVTFNSDVENSKRLCYIGEDSYHAGLLMGNLISEIIPNAKTIALLLGFKENHAHTQRCRGVKDAILSESPDVQFIEQEYQDDTDIAACVMKDILHHTDIDAVFAASGTGAWGVSEAIRNLDKQSRPKVFGYDASSRTVELMKNGLCQAVIFQDPYWQGYFALKILAEYLILKQPIQREQYIIRSKLALKNNVEECLSDKKMNSRYLI